MAKVVYRIIEHDGGWAYQVDGVFSETFPSHDMARMAALRAAAEQHVPVRNPRHLMGGQQWKVARGIGAR